MILEPIEISNRRHLVNYRL